MTVTRVTLLKVPEAEDREKLLTIYKTMTQDAVKLPRGKTLMPTKNKQDGKPYIRSLKAGSTFEDQRNQGYTLAVVSEFNNIDDMRYYDSGCQAHARLKSVGKDMHEGVMTVYFESVTSPVERL
ncbi:hypothetical protein PRK78_005043 [Emydomyces testavorans]|uniref:Stress-response A/B barrel domain-containing protein n=1 Tax=Emydomyces testavorans TaxID=2070801 RepID=A0AAF0DJR8_9EURO|nr:hypothetical protein PRK78_005043 [Emydomyces testavorans]